MCPNQRLLVRNVRGLQSHLKKIGERRDESVLHISRRIIYEIHSTVRFGVRELDTSLCVSFSHQPSGRERVQSDFPWYEVNPCNGAIWDSSSSLKSDE